MSLRPHFRRPQYEAPAAPKQGSRIPTKAALENGSNAPRSTQNVSKSAKRVSRSGLPVRDTGSSGVTRAQPSVATAQNTADSTRRLSNTPLARTTAPPTPLIDEALAPPSVMRTPSLVSGGSSVSTFDSPKTQGLRRKPSGAIDRYAAQKRADSTSIDVDRRTISSGHGFYSSADYEDSVLGITLPPTAAFDNRTDHLSVQSNPTDASNHPALSRLITPPAPPYAQSATPSTRYTDSPFSHAPTPSSASSYSPATAAFAGNANFVLSSSPVQIKSPVYGRVNSKDTVPRTGLAPVRESSTSSSQSMAQVQKSRLPSAKGEGLSRVASRESATKKSDSKPTAARNKLTKTQPVSSSGKRPAQAPPELAHLNVDPSPTLSPQKPPPPTRPSRIGTPNLSDITSPSPVVQSDLPRLYTTYHKRTPSQETPLTAESPKVRSRIAFSSPKSSASITSPRIDSAISPPPSARKLSRGTTPEIPSSEGAPLKRKDSPAVAGTSPAKPRFGFFSRKSKTEAPKTTEKPKRQPIKGPAAGTGHEGYARFGLRGRSGSSASSTGLRSSSADSSTSSLPLHLSSSRKGSLASKDGSDMDDFLRERLTPVILRGSGGNSMKTISSSASSAISMSVASQTPSLAEPGTQLQLLPSAMQHPRSVSPAKRPSLPRRKVSDSSEDDVLARFPNLAGGPSLAVPTRMNYETSPGISPRHTLDVSTSSVPDNGVEKKISSVSDSQDDGWANSFDLQEGQWFGSKKTLPTANQDRKRNFSQHAQASPRPKGKERAVESDYSPMKVEQPPRPPIVAHYAFSHPVEPVDLEEVERIMLEHETSAEDSMSETGSMPKVVPYEGRHIGLLPAPPKYRNDTSQRFGSKLRAPKVALPRQSPSESAENVPVQHASIPALSKSSAHAHVPQGPQPRPSNALERSANSNLQPVVTPEMRQTAFDVPAENKTDISPPRPPRLSPIGRIPPVVSKRDRDRKLPDNSFSRPFARAQPRPSVKPPGAVYSQIREMAASPTDSLSQLALNNDLPMDLYPTDPVASLRARNGLPIDHSSMELDPAGEFLNFSPRKDSGQSYSSSSGYPSWTATLDALPQQEDVWNEYNDFMDEVMPFRNPMAASSFGVTLPTEYVSQNAYERSYRIPSMVGAPPSVDLPFPPGFSPVSTVLPLPQQVAKFLQPSLSPISSNWRQSGASDIIDDSHIAPAEADQIGGSGIRRTSIPQSARFSASSLSSRYSRGSVHSRSASLPDANARNSQLGFTTAARFNRDNQLVDIAESESAQDRASSSLRVPALLTSKWLSFGRVLFSPAHNEMRLAEQPRVLVVDELSSDWSHFVALSYPSATVYNLSTDAKDPQLHEQQQQQRPPSNHRQIRIGSLSTPFPFPKGFFNAVVFRFPKATTEQTYQSTVFECKRVLRPGGFLEVSVLDLDLMNMGSEARRAVRGLKTRMQQRDRGVSLKNLSDVLVRLMGRRGFEGVQRCIVGVPAAGRIPRSQDNSSVSSDGYSSKPVWDMENYDDNGGEFSFADLLERTRNSQIGPGNGNDEAITKMVAKVGRWWYSSCYEKTLLPSDQSIWSNRSLLRECERQGTSFRLFICHAQKPAQPRRRTVSV